MKDCLNLKTSLGKLGFDVRIYTDPTVKNVTTTLQSSEYELRPQHPKDANVPHVSLSARQDQTDGGTVVTLAPLSSPSPCPCR